MNTLRDAPWLAAALLAVVLAGCGSDGDINISADDNSVVNNPPSGGDGGSNNPCASYQIAGSQTLRQGSFDGTNCTYGTDFVGVGNPLTQDLLIPFISGTHIFRDALIMGEDVITDGTPAPTGGDGPVLTIEAGNTLAFLDASDYVLINRGSQIVANGSAAAPITFTGFADVSGTADPEAVQLWGGMVINGNGVTNRCSDAERAAFTCNILSEGVAANYGGGDNAESSGVLRYVVIKHTGFEVAPDNELNGVTFNTVGSGTQVEFLQTYSTFDDGIEFFGGAVDVSFYVGLYTRDDTIDFADGYVGNISNALVIHSGMNRAGRCIEADNNEDAFDLEPLTNPTISNLTCITSGIDNPTFDDSEGPLLRRGVAAQIVNSIVWDGYLGMGATAGNECFEIDDDNTRQKAEAGTTTMKSTVISCNTPTQDSLTNGDTIEQWVLNTGANGTYPANTGNAIVTRSASSLSRAFETGGNCFFSTELLGGSGDIVGSTFLDDTGASFDVLAEGGGIIGAVSASADWTQNWTFGLNDPDLWIRSSPNCL